MEFGEALFFATTSVVNVQCRLCFNFHFFGFWKENSFLCIVFRVGVCFSTFRFMTFDADIATMRTNYINGGYGYGHAKQALYELLCERFGTQREKYWHLMENRSELDLELDKGAEKARAIIGNVVGRVREKLGY